METAAVTDQELVALVRSGDEDAAKTLYERYARRIHGLISGRMSQTLKSQTQPEDIVQSVFKSIFRGVTQGGYDAPEGGTLWRLIAVVAIHKVRRRGGRLLVQKRDVRRTESLDGLESSTDIPCDPEAFELAIGEALEGLKAEEQKVAILRVQGYTVEEISEQLDRSRRSVERQLQSIRVKLSQMLEVPRHGISDGIQTAGTSEDMVP